MDSPIPNPFEPLAMQPPVVALGMLIFGEARSLTHAGRVAVGCVVRNRVNLDTAEFGYGWRGVIVRPYAFSCFNSNDPNRPKLFEPKKFEKPEVWDGCLVAAQEVMNGAPDTTCGAVFYYSLPLTDIPRKKDGSSAWGRVDLAATIEGLRFFRKAA